MTMTVIGAASLGMPEMYSMNRLTATNRGMMNIAEKAMTNFLASVSVLVFFFAGGELLIGLSFHDPRSSPPPRDSADGVSALMRPILVAETVRVKFNCPGTPSLGP